MKACVLLFGLIVFIFIILIRSPPQIPGEVSTESGIDFVAISMAHRIQSHFEPLKKILARENIKLQLFEGINGKSLNLNDYNLTAHYRAFFENNEKEFQAGKTKTRYKGHLGAALSHLQVLRNLKNMTVIFEDDVDVHTQFNSKLQNALAAVTELDPNWDILLLGFTAKYKDFHFHKLNDRSPIYPGGIVKVHAFIGLWGYVVRGRQVAQKILKLFDVLRWNIDLVLSEENRNGNLNIYGCMPTLADHAGVLRASSWNHNASGKWDTLKTDTNA